MKWLEITVLFTEEIKEALLVYLLDLDIQGVIEEESAYKFYLPENVDPETILTGDFGSLTYRTQLVEDENWAENWKKYWHANKIGRFVIVPSWEQYDKRSDETIIDLDPGMAFGTGAHETTALVLELLGEVLPLPKTVYDIGTGTGILAIAAAKLGAKIFAFDTDPLAVDASLANAKKNGVKDQVLVFGGNLLEDESLFPNETPDLVMTNIIAEVIVQFVPLLKEKLGHFTWLLSGIIVERLPLVLGCLKEHGFTVTKRIDKGEWVALEARI
ncbi:MAG: 50S ribosomal protein L11 methyltransferase [Firmicutes bacterium]|nr:50S ribosomal protein L11 methyltransferase [Bacillota bacterium]